VSVDSQPIATGTHTRRVRTEVAHMRASTRPIARQPILLLVGAISVFVIGCVHDYLYFRGGYRGIAPESFAGLTISRAFALNAIAGFAIAWALALSVRLPKLAGPAALAGTALAAGTLAAYLLSRTVGLLGFQDSQTTTESVVAAAAELVALVSLGSWLACSIGAPRRSRARTTRSA
jgi:hypothetical protein